MDIENKEIETCKLLYNTERVRLYIPEYGRNVQKMVDYLKTIEDREKRNEQARAIIKVMEIINPAVHLQDNFEQKLWDHLHIISGFDLDVDSPYYMLSKYMLDNDYWERLCRIPGTSQIRKAIIENYGCQVLNDWRKVQDMNWIVRNMHLSLVVPDGKYDEELAFCCAELLNTSRSYKNGNCERLVESKNTFDPLADMRELLDECVDSVVCLHHLSALVANPNGKLLLNLLEEKLQTPAKIYYKFEGNNTSGSHKLNSAIAQAYYAKQQGLKGVTTETGAGQWGTALSMACSYFDLDCKVYMVKCSYEQKPFRREVMRTYGATVTPSPSMDTAVGRKILEKHPGTSGSLGCAISEAVEAAQNLDGYRYVLGSVLNQVMLHQTVIGLEAKTAMDKYNIKPDIIIGCAGGGSNLGGLIAPFMVEKIKF